MVKSIQDWLKLTVNDDIESKYYRLLEILKKVNDDAKEDKDASLGTMIDLMIEAEFAHQEFFGDDINRLMHIKLCKYVLELYYIKLRNIENEVDMVKFANKNIYKLIKKSSTVV